MAGPPHAAVSFDRIAEDYDRTRGGTARGESFAKQLTTWLTPGITLEIGAGTGLVADALRRHGNDVIGTDISHPMLQRARARVGSTVAQADAYTLPFPDGSLDNVYTVWVLQLVTDHRRFYAEAARVLRPGGRVINIAGRGTYPADDDMAALIIPLHNKLRSDADEGGVLLQAGSHAGLSLVSESFVALHTFEASPNEQADIHERRALSIVWDLPSDVWQAEVVPVIEALRALPEPNRPRLRRPLSAVTIFEKPYSATT